MPLSYDTHPMIATAFDTGLVMARAAEHLLGAFIGAFSIYLGYRLFLHLPDKTDSEGKIALPGGINIWLSRVGPGVFFSLFGTALVALSLYQRLELVSKNITDSIATKTGANALIQPAAAAAVENSPVPSAIPRNPCGNRQPLAGGRPRKKQIQQKSNSESLVVRQTIEERVGYEVPGLPNVPTQQLPALRADARLAIVELNAIPGLLADGTPGKKRAEIENVLRDSKLAILQSVWGKDWGDFAIFRNWMRNGALGPAPKGVKPKVVELFQASREER